MAVSYNKLWKLLIYKHKMIQIIGCEGYEKLKRIGERRFRLNLGWKVNKRWQKKH